MTQDIEHWKQGTIGEYPAMEADGHEKSFKHQEIEAEVVIYKQHRGMQMFYDVGLATPSDKEHREYDLKPISSELNSAGAAIEEAEEYMKNHPMAGKKGKIFCKDCKEKIGLSVNENDFLMCDPCENYESLDEGEESEHFLVFTEDGKQAFVRGEE